MSNDVFGMTFAAIFFLVIGLGFALIIAGYGNGWKDGVQSNTCTPIQVAPS